MKRTLPMIPAVFAILFGCSTVGPDYKKPALRDSDYSDVLQPESEGVSRGQGEITPEMLAEWWNTLDDPVLTELIHRGLTGSLDLREAEASVREARGLLGIGESRLFPFLDAQGVYEKSESSENLAVDLGELDFYQAGFDANWELDVFGGTRKNIAAARADLQAEQDNLKAVWVSLAGEIARNYIELRTLQQRLRVAQSNLEAQAETLEILESSYEVGLSDELAVQQARYNLERTRSTIPTIQSGREAAQNALAVLVGETPGSLHRLLRDSKPIPVSSLKTVTGIPANVLRQRPDIRAAERRLAAQTERIGVAESDLYPKFYLFGSIGLESLDSSSFFSTDSRAWNIGPSISWPIFHAGSIRNNIQVQTARQEQSLARYEKAVLTAIKEVRDALVAYAEEQKRREALLAAVEAAQAAVEVSQDKYKNGLVDFNNVLDGQRSLLSLQDQLAVSEGTISTNLVRLYKALGGGWEAMERSSR